MEKDSQQIILATARKHFVQKGFAATRTQEIADEAGMNKALLHYYFRSKELLYQEVLKQIMRTMVPRLAQALTAEGGFWVRVERLVDTYIQTISENPDIPIFIMSELSQQKQSFIDELKSQTSNFKDIQSFMTLMAEEMQSGAIRTIPPAHLLLNILGMTVFPFLSKPIFSTVFNVSDDEFYALMMERKKIIIDFLKQALIPDKTNS